MAADKGVNNPLYAAGLDVAAAFASIVPAAEEATVAIEDNVSATQQAATQIRDAWKSITDSLFEEVARIKGLILGNSEAGLANAQDRFNTATMLARSGDQQAAKDLPELSKIMLDLASGQASTLIELRRTQALTAASLQQTATGINNSYGIPIPAYADGGMYQGGLALVGETGPELINFNQGGQVYNANQTANMLRSSELVQRLISEVELLRVETRAIAISSSKLNNNFERSLVPTPEGEALLTKVAA